MAFVSQRNINGWQKVAERTLQKNKVWGGWRQH